MATAGSRSDERRSLLLRFVLHEEQPVSTTDVLSVVALADEYGGYIALREAAGLLDELGVDRDDQFPLLEEIRYRSVGPEFLAVRRGSITLEAALNSAFILFALTSLGNIFLKDAWDSSRAKQRVTTFIRDKMFGGAKQEAEEKRLATPQVNNVSVQNIQVINVDRIEAPAQPGDRALQIDLKRQNVITVTKSDQQLLDEFVKKLERARRQ